MTVVGARVSRQAQHHRPISSPTTRTLGSVAPNLIWGPYPTPFAAPEVRAAPPTPVRRAARCAAPPTTAVWAPPPSYPRLPRVSRRDQHPTPSRLRPLAPPNSVAPNLIWGPNPTLFAAPEVRAARQRPFAGHLGALRRQRPLYGPHHRHTRACRGYLAATSTQPRPVSDTRTLGSVAPNLIWGPNPTPFTARGTGVAC